MYSKQFSYSAGPGRHVARSWSDGNNADGSSHCKTFCWTYVGLVETSQSIKRRTESSESVQTSTLWGIDRNAVQSLETRWDEQPLNIQTYDTDSGAWSNFFLVLLNLMWVITVSLLMYQPKSLRKMRRSLLRILLDHPTRRWRRK